MPPQPLENDLFQMRYDTGHQSFPMMQLALSNLLRSIQNQTMQQHQSPALITGNNIALYQQLLQIQQQNVAAPLGGNNELNQALLTVVASQQQTSNKHSDHSSEHDVSQRHISSSSGPSVSSSTEKRRTMVVPCRARGMSVEHNFQVRKLSIFSCRPQVCWKCSRTVDW